MKTEKFKHLFNFAKKSKLKASDGSEKGEYPFYTSSTIISKRTDKAQFFDESIVFGNGGTANVHYTKEPFGTTSHCYVATRKNNEINTKYVYYYLYGNLHILERGFKGAGLKNISSKYIAEIDIPILPLETQNKIVDVLDRASSLVKKRKQTIELLDELLRATFLDMFGDPQVNPHKFPLRFLKEFYIDPKFGTKCGPFGSALKKGEYTEKGIPVWNMDNITKDGNFIDEPNLFINQDKYFELEKYQILNNDVIISRAGTVGKMCVVSTQFPTSIISTNLIRVRFNDKQLLPNYFVALMLYCKGGVGRLKKGGDGAFTHMSTKVLDSLEFPYPKIELQEKFLIIQNEFKVRKRKLQESYSYLKNLLLSLTQKVFNGELNFNIDFELDALVREIDLEKKENDLSTISGDIAYLQRLIDKLNVQEFEEKEMYDKAKHAVFQLLKEDKKVTQEYNEKSNNVKLVLK